MIKRKHKRGRPKGSKNKNHLTIEDYSEKILKPMVVDGTKLRIRLPKDYVISDGPVTGIEEQSENLKSRLDECMLKLETAVFEAIIKLKGSF